jgi:thioredoxin-like negative regulator of GroEL
VTTTPDLTRERFARVATLLGMTQKAHARILSVRDDNFDAEVLSSVSPLPILVDFGTAWCSPCKLLWPVLERMASEYAGRLVVGKADIDESPGLTTRLAIRGAPTVVAFRHGREIGRRLGLTNRAALLALCELEAPA